jgi:oligopeptide transport system substrate-binding protein
MKIVNKIITLSALVAGLWFYSKINKKKVEEKVLNLSISRPVVTLDPVIAEDNESIHEIAKVYEGLLEYHYLKKPVEIIPNLAESMPEISEEETKYTFRVKKKVFFQDNICFKDGKGRELKASDFVYSIKRLADPKNNSPLLHFIEGKILGLDNWIEKNKNLEKTDYNLDIEGLKIIDDYTFSVKLTKKNPLFIHVFCMWILFAVPKEAVDFYGENFKNNPVGTGPFVIKNFSTTENTIVAEKNRNYRDKFYPKTSTSNLSHLLITQEKKLPFVDKIITNLIIEDQTKFLKFKSKSIDILNMYGSSSLNEKIKNNEIIDKDLIKEDTKLYIRPFSNTNMWAFNCENDVLKNEKIRQAISLCYDRDLENDLLNGNIFTTAKGIIPPTMLGYEENIETEFTKVNIEKAKKLIKEAGYKEGELKITIDIKQGNQEFLEAEFLKKCMEKIGIKGEIYVNSWPELLNKLRNKNCQIYKMQWFADYPDAENFLMLFYSKGTGIYTNYFNKKYDEIYLKSFDINFEDTKEREKHYKELNNIIMQDLPIIPKIHASQIFFCQKNILNFEPWDVKMNIYEYIDKK